VFRARAKLFGFALSPDGSTVLVGYGDPRGGAGEVVTGPFGVFRSSTDAFSFEPIFSGYAGCVAWTKSGVYVCGSQSSDGFELAFAPTADFGPDAASLEPLLVLNRVAGPLACGSGTRGLICAAAWDVACATFGACPDAGAARPDASVDAARADDGAATSQPDVERGGACGCRVADRTHASFARWMLLGFLAVTRRCRRRSSAEHDAQPSFFL
jgi:hypothetical protein